MRALSTRNDDPAAASRPFDIARDGFVMGEAGAILVLESLEHAERARGRALLRGAGLRPHRRRPPPHRARPHRRRRPRPRSRWRSTDAGDRPRARSTTSTRTPPRRRSGDPSEVRALRRALGDEVAARTLVSSTKSMHGHCLGAAGGVEGALTALTIREGVVPPTINLDDLDPGCVGVDHVANEARDGRRPRGHLDRVRLRRPQRDPGAGPPGGPVDAAGRLPRPAGDAQPREHPHLRTAPRPGGPVVGRTGSASPSAASRWATPCGGCPRPASRTS